jgi:hypothetical protein
MQLNCSAGRTTVRRKSQWRSHIRQFNFDSDLKTEVQVECSHKIIEVDSIIQNNKSAFTATILLDSLNFAIAAV